MRHNVVIPIALVLVILVGGWAYLNQFSDVSPQMEEELPPTDDKRKPSSPTDETPKGETWDFFQGLLPGLQDLVNASVEPEELLEFVMNTTGQLEELFDETEDVKGESLTLILDFFKGLEVELQGLIDEGSSSKDLLDHVTEKMGELKEDSSEKPKRG